MTGSRLVIPGNWLKTPSQDLTFWKCTGSNAPKIRLFKDNSELDLPNHQLFLKAEIPIPWLCFLSHCSCGIFRHLRLKQRPRSKNHPDSVRYIYWTSKDESNEKKNNCFFQDFGVFGIHAPLYSGHIYSVFSKSKSYSFDLWEGLLQLGTEASLLLLPKI